MRKVGAAAREALIDLAAVKWNVDRGSITVAGGKLKNNVKNHITNYAVI